MKLACFFVALTLSGAIGPRIQVDPAPTSVTRVTTQRDSLSPGAASVLRRSDSLSAAELDDLRRLKMERELEDAVLAWAQRRFWFVAIVSIAVGFFGVRSLVRELIAGELKEAMRVTAVAQAAADNAKEATKRVQTDAENSQAALEAVRKTASSMEVELAELRGIISAEAENAKRAADLGLGGIQRQIDALSQTVSELARGRPETTDPLIEQRKLKHEAAAAREEFSTRSAFSIEVFGADEAVPVVAALREVGYRVTHAPRTYSGINARTILYAPAATTALPDVLAILEAATGGVYAAQQLPYKGIQDVGTSFLVFLKGSRDRGSATRWEQ